MFRYELALSKTAHFDFHALIFKHAYVDGTLEVNAYFLVNTSTCVFILCWVYKNGFNQIKCLSFLLVHYPYISLIFLCLYNYVIMYDIIVTLVLFHVMSVLFIPLVNAYSCLKIGAMLTLLLLSSSSSSLPLTTYALTYSFLRKKEQSTNI